MEMNISKDRLIAVLEREFHCKIDKLHVYSHYKAPWLTMYYKNEDKTPENSNATST